MQSKNMNNKLFAQYTGINEGTLSLLLRDKAQPTLKIYEAIHKHFPDISMEWLFDGVGPMYKKDAAAQSSDPSVNGSASAVAEEQSSSDTNGDASTANGVDSSAPLFSDNNRQQAAVISQIDKSVEKAVVKYVDKPHRKITEIRVFFDDQTWESFVPKKED